MAVFFFAAAFFGAVFAAAFAAAFAAFFAGALGAAFRVTFGVAFGAFFAACPAGGATAGISAIASATAVLITDFRSLSTTACNSARMAAMISRFMASTSMPCPLSADCTTAAAISCMAVSILPVAATSATAMPAALA
ncbi:MAG: hypothetical protein CMN40_06240 [SAR116 cluster bacterium]|nr:hypothetical protein [SAR116 cluster bacterium]